MNMLLHLKITDILEVQCRNIARKHAVSNSQVTSGVHDSSHIKQHISKHVAYTHPFVLSSTIYDYDKKHAKVFTNYKCSA